MRFIALGLGLLCAGVASGAPRYHAVNLGAVPGSVAGHPTLVCGLGSDGAIAYWDISSSAAATGIYHEGQFRTLQSITGVPLKFSFKLKDANHWLAPYANYFRFGDEATGGAATQNSPYVRGGGMSTLSGDFTYYRHKDNSHDGNWSDALIRRNGQDLLIQPISNTANWSIDMSEGGWIVGGSSIYSPFESSYQCWILAPGSLTPRLLPSWLGRVYKVADDPYFYGSDGSNMRLRKDSSSYDYLLDPLGKKTDYELDANNKGQVALDTFRATLNGVPQHRTIALWENGSSFYIEESLDNPGAFIKGLDMDGLAINDKGQIATCLRVGTTSYLYRFDPVPEPGTLLALGAGIAAIAVRRKRR